MWNITTKALLHLGVILVVDVFFHYLYILTIPNDMTLVNKLSDWSLGEPSLPHLAATFLLAMTVHNRPKCAFLPLQPAWRTPTWCTTG